MLAQPVASVYKKRIVLYSKEQLNNAQRSTYKLTVWFMLWEHKAIYLHLKEKNNSLLLYSIY